MRHRQNRLLFRKNGTGQRGRQVKVRDQRKKLPIRMERETHTHRQTAIHHRSGQTAEEGGSQVVRVAFHGVGDVQQTLGGQLVATQHVGAHSAGHQQRCGRAKTTADGDLTFDVDFNATDLLAEGCQHGAVGGVGHIVRTRVSLVTAGDQEACIGLFKGHIGVEVQGAAEGIKAGAQIGGGGGHTDGYSFHRFSPVSEINCSLSFR